MRKWRKWPETSPNNSHDRTHKTTDSSRRNFLKTASAAAGAAFIPESIWARGKPATATNRNAAFPEIERQFMITPDQAWDWASFKSKGGPTYAGGTGWKRYSDFLISKLPELGAVDLDYVEIPYDH